MKKIFLQAFLLLCSLAAQTQPVPDPTIGHEPGKRPPINTAGWYPTTVSYAPDESNVVVTACTAERHKLWNPPEPARCTVMRYQIEAQRWEALPEIDQEAFYSNVSYTFDGSGIFAQEQIKCPVGSVDARTLAYCTYLVLLDMNGKKIKNLTTSHNAYLHPSMTRDGKKVLFWGVSNQLYANMGGGAWDVKELDIATQKITQKTDYQAAFPKTTPRYLMDGKRLMLAAEAYPKRPNWDDFFSRLDPQTGEKRYFDYVSKFGRNMTVVVDSPNAPIKPYFPTLKKVEVSGKTEWQSTSEHMWLIVQDVSRDGKLAVFGGQGLCFRFVDEPLREPQCFSNPQIGKLTGTGYSSEIVAASIASSRKTVAVISGGYPYGISDHLRFIDVATGYVQRIGMRWDQQSPTKTEN